MQRVIALLGLAALVSGCAAALPYTSFLTPPSGGGLEIHNQTDVRLQDENFVVMRTNVVGEAKGFALLGFITIVPAKFNTAMNRLYGKAAMQPGKPQTLAGLVMEKTSAYWILFSIPRVSIRADVVEFRSPPRPYVPGVSLLGEPELKPAERLKD